MDVWFQKDYIDATAAAVPYIIVVRLYINYTVLYIILLIPTMSPTGIQFLAIKHITAHINSSLHCLMNIQLNSICNFMRVL